MTNSPVHQRRINTMPFYCISIVLIFILPVCAFLKFLWDRIPKSSFFVSVFIISVIGWAWSWLVSSNGWWSFGPQFMLGVNIIPNLPLEEFLFYPFGGALCLMIYIYSERFQRWTSARFYWAFLLGGSALFVLLGLNSRGGVPWYMTSQIVVFNAYCLMGVGSWNAGRVNLKGIFILVLLLSGVGYFWDFTAFKYGWWTYHAITEFRIFTVPVDDFNFFLYAPPSAVSIYLFVCRFLKSPAALGSPLK